MTDRPSPRPYADRTLPTAARRAVREQGAAR